MGRMSRRVQGSRPGAPGRRAFLQALPALAAVAQACRRRPALEQPFRIALPYELDSLDPHASSTVAAFTVLGNIYDPLAFSSAGQALRPGLAQTWSNPEPLSWIFELRPGVCFHSGRPVEARDVVASIERVRHDPALDVRYYVGRIADVEALDARHVRIRTQRRAPALLSQLGHVFIVPAERSSDADGSGPYRVTQWQPGRFLALERNDAYWGGPASIRRAEFSLNLAPGEILRRLASGEQELALLGLTRSGDAPPDLPNHALRRRSGLQVEYLAFDLGRSATPFCALTPNPFRDRRVREAFHLALDRPRLVAGLPRHAVPASQLVPREVFGFAPNLPEVRYQPERARSLLREAGLADGLKATLHTRELLEDAAYGVRDQLRRVGIELEVQALPDAAYFADLKRRAFSLWIDRWSCTTGESTELFETALHTRDAREGLGSFNESEYSNPGLDAAIERAIELEVPAERQLALQALMRQTMTELPWIPLFTRGELWAVRRGYAWSPRVDYWLHVADMRPLAG